MIEVYRSVNKINPSFMWDIFPKKIVHYSLRNSNLINVIRPKTENFGFRSITYRGAALWNNLPHEIKESENIIKFNSNIKQWNAPNCKCHLCR